MLLAIRDRISGLFAWVLIIVICIPFGLWGIQEYVSTGKETSVLLINDKEISLTDYNRQYSNNRQVLARSFGGRIPEFFNESDFLRKQTISTLTEQALIEQSAKESKFLASDAAVIGTITGLPNFQINGKFDQKAYESQLHSNGMSSREFEAEIRKQIVTNQIQQGISLTAFSSKKEIEQQARIKYQSRDVDYVLLPAEAYNKGVTVADAEISEYYEKNKAELKTEEQVTVEYIALSLSDYASKVTVTEEQLRQQYEDAEKNGSNMTTGEARNTSHILVSVPSGATEAQINEKKKKVQGIYARARSGEDFAQLAKTESEDPGSASQGGSLGEVGRGVMVKPFEDALFALKEGEISEPVKTTFGFHIIKLHSATAAKKIPFAEARAELEKVYRQQEAEKNFYDMNDVLATKAFENQDSLSAAAEATGLQIQESALFSRLSGEGIAHFQSIREAAFSSEVLGGSNSSPIELEANHAAVIRLKDHFPSRDKTLDEARESIKVTLTSKKVEDRIKGAGENLKAAILQKGVSDVLAAEYKGTLKSEKELKRGAGNVPFEVMTEAFRMQAPQVNAAPEVSSIKLGDGGYVVIVLKSVKQGDIAWVDTEEKNRLGKEVTDVAASKSMEMMVTNLKDKSKIVVNIKE